MKAAAQGSHRFVHFFHSGRYATGVEVPCRCGCLGWDVEWKVSGPPVAKLPPAIVAELLAVSRAYFNGGFK